MGSLKKMIYKLLFREKADSESYIRYLRGIGMTIGENCTIFTPRNVLITSQYPWMVSIGNNVQITQGFSLIDHDYSWSVLKHFQTEYGEGRILGASGPVSIGSNVFFGVNSTVLAGTTIGDNVIIGAGSVLRGNYPSGGVYVGVPAKRIMSIEEFYRKRMQKQFEEAKLLAQRYKEKFGINPSKEIFHEYFLLFEDSFDALPAQFKAKLALTGNGQDSRNYLEKQVPMFHDFDAFLSECYL